MGNLQHLRVLVTSGPTRERIDPVRYLTNDSSGKQGHAIAAAFAAKGADVTLVSGPVSIADPIGVNVVKVESAREMLTACEAALPVTVAICAAAVADFRPEYTYTDKLKKEGSETLTLTLIKNPDILATLGSHPLRPKLLIGFAAETSNLLAFAAEKRARKHSDWILANDVSPENNIFGGDQNKIALITEEGIEHWQWMPKEAVATLLAEKVEETLKFIPSP